MNILIISLNTHDENTMTFLQAEHVQVENTPNDIQILTSKFVQKQNTLITMKKYEGNHLLCPKTGLRAKT